MAECPVALTSSGSPWTPLNREGAGPWHGGQGAGSVVLVTVPGQRLEPIGKVQ